jgi:hypothetical protein
MQPTGLSFQSSSRFASRPHRHARVQNVFWTFFKTFFGCFSKRFLERAKGSRLTLSIPHRRTGALSKKQSLKSIYLWLPLFQVENHQYQQMRTCVSEQTLGSAAD